MTDMKGYTPTFPDDGGSPLPSAPTIGQILYNGEDQSDVIFMVVQGEKCWRFSAHCVILSSASSFFRSILERKKTRIDSVINVEIKHIQPHIFDTILKYIYRGAEEVCLNSTETTMQLLSASKKYLLHELSAICFRYLQDHVVKENVLKVLSCTKDLFASSSHEKEQNQQNELLTICFHIVDTHTQYLLQENDFENLEEYIVKDIVARDTISVQSEVMVFNALIRWACQECKRRKMEVTSINKRVILGKLLYSVRYLVMSLDDFSLGPAISGVLSDEEKNGLMARLKGDFSCPLPDQLNGRQLRTTRKGPFVSVNTTHPCHLAVVTNSEASLRSYSRRKKKTIKKLVQGLTDALVYVFRLLD
ncbi:BTB/POZ domain-containing protein 2-like [Limulus polyphemus]|uniref:BTB/POZ domain-containing protein 2-like n=1 Tax=Limulus polyphemus TaxID=6850 RepID=A0ABM1BRR7_LIMPO|nr:BTB/POZ domain-containing protein 2-like [Limulus polyphemus]